MGGRGADSIEYDPLTNIWDGMRGLERRETLLLPITIKTNNKTIYILRIFSKNMLKYVQ